MSQKNDEKIMDLLRSNREKEFKVTEIAEQTGIDIKNMSRYLKNLEEQQKIKVRPIQEGRIRTKLISFAEPEKSEMATDGSGPAADQTQEPGPVKIAENKELELIAKIGDLETENLKLQRRITQILKEPKFSQIQVEKVLKKIEALPPDNREFQNIVRRVQVQHRKSYIDEVINLVNQYFNELI